MTADRQGKDSTRSMTPPASGRKRWTARSVRWWIALAAAAGCASLAGDRLVQTPRGRIQVSQKELAPPAVVFVSGLAGRKETWNPVFDAIAGTNAVFAYDRPGVGRSERTSGPRDADAIVEELRAVLESQKVPKPYVLVGYSAGGLYVQLFARRHPKEVAGLVLVDPTHPTQFTGDGAMNQRSVLSNVVIAVALTGAPKEEFTALTESGRQVLEAPPLRADLPTVILIAPDRSTTPIAAFDNGKRRDFARLYPHATLREVDCGHHIPQERPEAVVDAIREVLQRSHEKR